MIVADCVMSILRFGVRVMARDSVDSKEKELTDLMDAKWLTNKWTGFWTIAHA